MATLKKERSHRALHRDIMVVTDPKECYERSWNRIEKET